MQIVTSWMEEGIEQGLEQGLERGRLQLRELLINQLSWRFGQLSSDIVAKISKLSTDRLQVLGLEMLAFTNIEELTAWLVKVEAENRVTEDEDDRHDEERSHEVN